MIKFKNLKFKMIGQQLLITKYNYKGKLGGNITSCRFINKSQILDVHKINFCEKVTLAYYSKNLIIKVRVDNTDLKSKLR